jgi:flagellar L-ring protein precursor FlgH
MSITLSNYTGREERMMSWRERGLIALIALIVTLIIGGCASSQTVSVHQPLTVRSAEPQRASYENGSIFAAVNYQPLFEDRRARHVGDTLIVSINENINASKGGETKTDRTGSVTASVPSISGLPLKTLQGLSVNGSSASSFDGKGQSSSNNTFAGIITVTVIEVLPNGNLLVSGEKQVGINQSTEFIRFSGVVNPTTIVSGNTVSSTQVADARIETRANGPLDEAQTVGWLQRVFHSFSPF